MPRRILQLIGDLNPAGAENVVVSLANRLKALDCHVVVCSREGGSLRSSLREVPTFIIPKKSLLDFRYLARLCSLIRQHRIEIIHSHLFGNDLYAFAAGTLTGTKTILTIHGEDSFKTKKRRRFYSLVARHVSKIVAVAEPLYRRLTRELRIPSEKVAFIPNGIDSSPFGAARDLRHLRVALRLPPAAPVIGAVGNIKPVKGYATLIEAATHVIQKVPDARFIVVGGVYQHEAYFKALQKHVRESHLQDNVCFLGQRDDVGDLLQLMDVYVLPSKSEGVSLALLEAMASRKPIVATSVGGTTDIVEHGRTGLLVPPEDPPALARSILHLLNNPSFAKSLGVSARRTVQEQFSLQSMVDKYRSLYNL